MYLACLVITAQVHVLVQTEPHATMSAETVIAWMALLVSIARKVSSNVRPDTSLQGTYYWRRKKSVVYVVAKS